MLLRLNVLWWLCFGLFVFLGVGCSCNLVVMPAGFPEPGLGPGDLKKDSFKLSNCLEIKPKLQDFGTQQIRCGGTLSREVEVVHKDLPSCPVAIRVNTVRLTSEASNGFQIVERPALPHTIAPGQSMTVRLSFQAKALQSLQDKLRITTTAPGQEELKIDLIGKGILDLPRKDTYKQVMQPSDILFIVDNSRSMRQEQAFLAKNFASFIQWAQRVHSNYHLGVIAIRTGDETLGCLAGSPKFLTPKTPNLAGAFERVATTLRRSSGKEMGLEAAMLALSEPKRSDPNCNKGFLRKNAVLSLIFISDEPDQSPEEYDFYLKFFKNIKNADGEERSHMVRASAVVGASPRGCSSSFGRAYPGPKYIQLSKDLQGVAASICDEDWSKPLEKIGLWSILSRINFPLKHKPIRNSIRVRVDGKTIPQREQDGWQYDATKNQVLFRGGAVPTPGMVIEIRYLEDCPETP